MTPVSLQPIITNDGKGKHQSYTAEAQYEFQTGNGSKIHLIIVGYGKDEFEARRNFVEERSTMERETERVFGLI